MVNRIGVKVKDDNLKLAREFGRTGSMFSGGRGEIMCGISVLNETE